MLKANLADYTREKLEEEFIKLQKQNDVQIDVIKALQDDWRIKISKSIFTDLIKDRQYREDCVVTLRKMNPDRENVSTEEILNLVAQNIAEYSFRFADAFTKQIEKGI